MEFPSRGARQNDIFYNSMSEIVEDTYNQIKSLLIVGNFAVFGHSMGALVAHDVCRKIMNNGDPSPNCDQIISWLVLKTELK